MHGYVRRCEAFVRDRLLPGLRRERQAIAEVVRNSKNNVVPQSHRMPINSRLRGMLWDILELRQVNTHAEFGLQRLRHAPSFTPEERLQYGEQIELYERADAGSRLLLRIASVLQSDEISACERELIARLDAWSRELQAWLEESLELV